MNSEELKLRTKRFAIDVFYLCKSFSRELGIYEYSRQLIRSSSSVGANYRAACRAKSKADFINKLKIVEEEIDESLFFLELLQEISKTDKEKIDKLIVEADKLTAIIVESINTVKKNLK